MTHHVPDGTTLTNVLEHLTEEGFEGMATAIELLINEAMKLERSEFLGAGPYERNAQRQGYANGFKAKKSRQCTSASESEVLAPMIDRLPSALTPVARRTATERTCPLWRTFS